MRLLSVDGWDLPCALEAAAAAGGHGRVIPSCRKKCERVLEELHGEMKAVHTLEVATPVVVVTRKNRCDMGGQQRNPQHCLRLAVPTADERAELLS